MNTICEIKNELTKELNKDIGNKRTWVRECPNCGIFWIITTLAGYKHSIKNNCVCKTCREIKIHKAQGHVINGIYKRVCFVCNKEREYKSWASSKRKSPCNECCKKLSRGVLRKNRLEVLCKDCNKIRFYTTSENKKLTSEQGSLCKSCSQKGKLGNRKGQTMPLSAKILLSKKLSGSNHPQYGKPLSTEHKRKIRVALINRLEKLKGKLLPNYNPTACDYFDRLNETKNYKIQHAENGGEYYIKSLGYWLDGYDEENNVVYEWYEKHHFEADGSIKKKDIDRKNEIIKSLHCAFVGYDKDGNRIINESPTI